MSIQDTRRFPGARGSMNKPKPKYEPGKYCSKCGYGPNFCHCSGNKPKLKRNDYRRALKAALTCGYFPAVIVAGTKDKVERAYRQGWNAAIKKARRESLRFWKVGNL